ncbi:MAG: ABC transporter permease [bacterium]|nr:ABC transporter permease [bacterium]
MFSNYFKTTIRSLLKNPFTTAINILGLAVAIGISIMVFSFLEQDKSIDQHHVNKNDTYLLTYFVNIDGTEKQYGKAPVPLYRHVNNEFTQIRSTTRIEDRNVVVKRGEDVFHESIRLVDPTFLEIMTFPLRLGDKESLQDQSTIILSHQMSQKYFGAIDPIGETIRIIFNEHFKKNFIVTGVAEKLPDAHAISFDFLINYSNIEHFDPKYVSQDWSLYNTGLLIQLDESSDFKILEQGLDKYRLIQNSKESDWSISKFKLESLNTLHARSSFILEDISYDDNVEARIGLPIIAIFMLLIACFNNVNIAIVSAAKRLKEIGLRKVIGANSSQVILQFLLENIVITTLALALGLLLSYLFILPWFSDLSGTLLLLDFNNLNFWVFLPVLILITGLISGGYPAIYISKFQIVGILKGSVKLGKKSPVTKMLLGVQIVLACTGITGAVMFAQNVEFQHNRSWGYNQKQTVYARVNSIGFERLKAELIKDPNVISISGSEHHLGKEIETIVLSQPDKKIEARSLSIEPGYLQTHGVNLKEGRFFKSNFEDDKTSLIVNEELVNNLSLSNPIGHVFKSDINRYEIVGVVKDFHLYSFYDKTRPTVFRVADENSYNYISIKSQEGKLEDVKESLQGSWARLFPETPFQGGEQAGVWSYFFDQVYTAEKFFNAVASIAILLAALGLYGLVKINVTGRTREFSIRKALGARMRNIAGNIMKQYAVLTIVSLTIGIPFSYLLIDANMKMLYAYPMPMTFSGIVIAVMIMILMMTIVMSSQIRRVAKSNPVDGLKVE